MFSTSIIISYLIPNEYIRHFHSLFQVSQLYKIDINDTVCFIVHRNGGHTHFLTLD